MGIAAYGECVDDVASQEIEHGYFAALHGDKAEKAIIGDGDGGGWGSEVNNAVWFCGWRGGTTIDGIEDINDADTCCSTGDVGEVGCAAIGMNWLSRIDR